MRRSGSGLTAITKNADVPVIGQENMLDMTVTEINNKETV